MLSDSSKDLRFISQLVVELPQRGKTFADPSNWYQGDTRGIGDDEMKEVEDTDGSR